jgi:hypothetical protein
MNQALQDFASTVPHKEVFVTVYERYADVDSELKGQYKNSHASAYLSTLDFQTRQSVMRGFKEVIMMNDMWMIVSAAELNRALGI